MAITLESLIAEATSAGLYVQSLCENYWNDHEPKWTCWLNNGITIPIRSRKGSGDTAIEALNAALNAKPSAEPPIEFTSYDTPTLDSILELKPSFTLSIKRRHLVATGPNP